MATLTTQQITTAGTIPTYTAATGGGGDEFAPGDRTFLHVKNGGGSSINVTVVTPGSAYGQAIADVVVAIAAGAEKMIGPFGAAGFQGADALVSVTYSAVTTVTAAVLSV